MLLGDESGDLLVLRNVKKHYPVTKGFLSTYFEDSPDVFTSSGQETIVRLFLYPPGGELEWMPLGMSKPSLAPQDCQPLLRVSGNVLTMRTSSAMSNSGLPGQCVSSQITQ